MSKKLVNTNQPHKLMLEKTKILGEHINDRSDMYKVMSPDNLGRSYAVDTDMAINITEGMKTTLPIAYMITGVEGKFYTVKPVTNKMILKQLSDELKQEAAIEAVDNIESRTDQEYEVPRLLIENTNDFYRKVKVDETTYLVEQDAIEEVSGFTTPEFNAYKVLNKTSENYEVEAVNDQTIKNNIVSAIDQENMFMSLNEVKTSDESPEMDLEEKLFMNYFNSKQ
ncbi:MAG: hypothetical protein ACLFTH_03010 [Candidatus Woesearchaeota archaeon]